MADEFTLRPPVAFTERMQSVQLAEVVSGAFAECDRVESGEMLLLLDLSEDGPGGAFDVAMVGEPGAAFADVNGSELPGSIVQVAE